MEDPCFDSLSDDLLVQVAHHLPLEDLCRLQRVSKRLRGVVLGAQSVWQVLYRATFPEPQAEGSGQAGGGSGGGGGGSSGNSAPAAMAIARAQHAEFNSASVVRSDGPSIQQTAGSEQEHASPVAAAAAAAAGLAQPGRQAGLASPVAPSSSSSRRNLTRRPAAAAAAAAAVPPPPSVATSAAVPLAAGQKRKRQGGTVDEEVIDWRERFKSRFVEESRRVRLQRQARLLKAESALQVLRQEVHRLEGALEREQRELPLLQQQLAAVQRARQQASSAALAQLYWQPVAVQQAHGRVTDQAPLDAEARERDLSQRVAVCQLEIRKLRAALAARRQRAAEAQKKLQALLP